MTKKTQRIETDLEGKVDGYVVWRQDWTEFEAGWGSRPDGYTLHATITDAKRAIAEHWREERERNPSGRVPDCYVAPTGDSYKVLVDKETYESVKKSDGGIWG